MLKIIFKTQAVYYFLTGIWPILHLPSFLAVTGPKTDLWLVKMVGLLTVSIGLMLFFQAKNKPYILAISALLSYIAIDVYYVFGGVIPPIYLADAVVEVILLFLIVIYWKK